MVRFVKKRGVALEMEEETTMTLMEVVRMNTWLQAKGVSAEDILDCQRFIATGIGLPKKEPAKKEST